MKEKEEEDLNSQEDDELNSQEEDELNSQEEAENGESDGSLEDDVENGEMEEDYDSEDSLDRVMASTNVPSSKRKEAEPGSSSDKTKKVYKKGIVYLSFIPPLMTVTKIVQLMSQYGKVGRVYFQPADCYKGNKKLKKKKKKIFSEGWVEFLKKKVAKAVALNLNNKCIGGKKGSRYHDYIWNIKYLPRFKWIHLSERLSYERAVYKQRMQTEISQARRLATQFLENVEMAERLNKKKKENPGNVAPPALANIYKQRETDSVKREKSKFKKEKEPREEFLKNIFS